MAGDVDAAPSPGTPAALAVHFLLPFFLSLVFDLLARSVLRCQLCPSYSFLSLH